VPPVVPPGRAPRASACESYRELIACGNHAGPQTGAAARKLDDLIDQVSREG